MIRESRARALLYVLFTLSGFAGLIYESIWSHYLKLFLGHAAYAQTLVLVIFMGGMAIGSWIAGRWTARLENPLRTYAWIEAALGLGALAFDPLFRGMQSWMFDTIMPSLDSPLLIDLCKWSASAMIVLPQSILLGATFPLISAGVIRLEPASHGRVLGWLYFTNSIGASIGVLVSGFVLIGLLGLPGTILSAGAINFVLAAMVLWLSRSLGDALPPIPGKAASNAGPGTGISRPMPAVAFFTGMASFFYEIGWLRMLSLVLGSATHAFELMLSAFILGIALGSFLIRSHIDGSPRPLRMLAWIQIAMATAAFLTIPVYNHSFDGMAFVLNALKASEQGYALFNLLSHGICMVIMLPVTLFAGMTLPLITAVMLREQAGESSIGRIYAANTLGSIAGVLLAVHLVLPLLGLRQVVVVGALVDLSVGLWLLGRAEPTEAQWRPRLGVAAAALVATVIIAAVPFDPLKLASGVFRYGKATRSNATILYHHDGKTASVDVFRTADVGIAIATNGKPDAFISSDMHSGHDDYTMALAGLMPSLLVPEARNAAVIGIGSGRTTHALLLNSHLQSVDTVEIEPGMVTGARLFGDFSRNTFVDPRSHIHIDDAKTYFARQHRLYDFIVAEPSNPWVSGVSSLFSREFYQQIRRHLQPDGVFVQWVQLYEINVPLVTTIAKAIDRNFDDYEIFATFDSDMLIIARPHGSLPPLSEAATQQPGIRELLDHLDLGSMADLNDRKLGTRRTLGPYFRASPWPENSDYYPILDESAVKYRFLHVNALELLTLRRASARLEGNNAGAAVLTRKHDYHEGMFAQQGQRIADLLAGRLPADAVSDAFDDDTLETVAGLRTLDQQCDTKTQDAVWLPRFLDFGERYLPYLSPETASDLMGQLRASKCFSQATPKVQHWFELLSASAGGNWQAARRAGEVLLDTHLHDLGTLQLLARELLLADVQAGDFEAAGRHAARFNADVFGAPPIEYLRAYAAAQLADRNRH